MQLSSLPGRVFLDGSSWINQMRKVGENKTRACTDTGRQKDSFVTPTGTESIQKVHTVLVSDS